MGSCCSTIAGKIGDCLFDAASREFNYWYNCDANTEGLKNEARKLKYLRERVQGEIFEAQSKGEIILPYVIEWREKVDGITKEVESFIEEEDKAKSRCLCIDDPCWRYRCGKEAQSKTEAVSKLQEDVRFDSVSRPAPPPGIIPYSEALSVNFKSRESVTKKIMEALKDENVSIIGICGMGGVGKTTLMNGISQQAVDNKVFDTVAMAVVSQTQNYVKIQGEIANILGFTLPSDDDVSARARFLWQRIMEKEKPEREDKPKPKPKQKQEREPKYKWKWNIKRKQEEKQKQKQKGEQKPELERILIILDNVWEEIDLQRVGIPFGDHRRGCKIVLTSRDQHVCTKMNAATFTVQILQEEESWNLFRDVAGEIVDRSDINLIAREVAKECGGLPIAIVTVAGALKKQKNKHVWSDAARQLKMSSPTNVKGVEKKVYRSLELSYDYLENEGEKSVFLLCCLFPEDFNIPIELLMRYGMGLQLFEEDVEKVEDARDRTHTVVSTLTSSFLLVAGNDEKHVKMHDVVRDFAIKLSKDKHMFMVKAGIKLQGWPSAGNFKDFTRISLISNDIREVPDGLQYPNLKALLLQQNSGLVVSSNFFQGMKDLTVLDMSCIHGLSLPLSLTLLAKLTTLCLNDCIFRDKAVISFIGRLTNLEILSLRGTNITEIPEDFKQLEKLRVFDLTACLDLKHIQEVVISSLENLEELYVSYSYDYEIKGLLIELKSLSRQTILRIRAHEFRPRLINLLGHAIMSSRMPFLNRRSFVIEIGYGGLEPLVKFSSWSKILYIAGISYQSADWAYQLPTDLTEVLQLCEIVNLRNFLLDLEKLGFNDLKFLQLSHCNETTYLLNSLECAPSVVFNSLENLWMDTMLKMVEICHGPLPAKSFCKLKWMCVSYCHKLSTIVPSHLLQRLHRLENFEAVNCSMVIYVFDFKKPTVAKGKTKFLSLLQILRLVDLPRMIEIWNGDAELISLFNLKMIVLENCSMLRKVFSPAILPSLCHLEHMEIKDCSSLEEIFGKEEEAEDHQENEIVAVKIDSTTTSPSLGNLTSIKISGCHRLKTLFTPSIVKGLVNLTTLEVERCRTMEEIVSEEKAETGASMEMIVLPSLYKIELKELHSLVCFSAAHCTIEFPCLESLDVEDCPKMKTFGHAKLNMNITVQQFFMEKPGRMKH